MANNKKKVTLTPKDLLDKWGSITAVATAANCLDKGAYPHNYAQSVRNSIAYLAKLHETLVEDALKHPQAHMISELKEIQKQIKASRKEKTNGQEAIRDADITANAPVLHPTPGPASGSEAHS